MAVTDESPESHHTKITYVDGRPSTLTLRRCRLEVIRSGDVERHVFDQDRITVGSSPDNDLVVTDDTVSRNHCVIYKEGDDYLLKDLESTNGTFANRMRIREVFLKPDCVVMIGKSEIRFAPVDEQLRIVPSEKQRFGEIIGRDARMREIYSILEKIAPTDATVVVEGETGTGKDVVARSIHQLSRRSEAPFMVFDCSAVPDNLIESELFGHEKGSFTGALTTRQGVFEMADGGTVFLDELGELSLELQPKLLRVLEQREIKRVGSNRPIKVNVRVVAATNRDLEKEVREGRFREDLFYRLSVVRIALPPLKERRDDIPLLIDHFLSTGHFNQGPGDTRRISDISPDAYEIIMGYDWPGNVRELHNVIERAVSFAEGDAIEVYDLPEHMANGQPLIRREPDTQTNISMPGAALPDPASGSFKDVKEQWIATFEKEYIEALLKKNSGNISHASREADIDRKYFRKLMKKYGITAADTSD